MELEVQAETRALEKQTALNERLTELRKEQTLLKQEAARARESAKGRFKLSSCRWSAHEVQQLCQLYASDALAWKKVKELRAASAASPVPPPPETQSWILRARPDRPEKPPEPDFVKVISWNRRAFRNCAIALRDHQGDKEV